MTIGAVWLIGAIVPHGALAATAKHVVLIAGTKSHPVGQHEYLKTVKLLNYLLEHASNVSGIVADTYFNGWPDDPRALDTADCIVTMADSGDYPENAAPVSFLSGERMAILLRAMQRGAGLVTLHSVTFAPAIFSQQILAWTGGYFDWQGGNADGGFYGYPVDDHTRHWHSIIRTELGHTTLSSPQHPISNGVRPFSIFDEYYYQLRFSEGPGWTPILAVPAFSLRPADQVVAWALQRHDGGRGFGFTPGHYYANWRDEDFRKLVLNAIVWSAGLPVPPEGVESPFATEDEVNRAGMVNPLPTLIVGDGTNLQYFTATLAPAVISALNTETPRFDATVSPNAAPLDGDLSRYRLVVLAGCGMLAGGGPTRGAGEARRLAGLRRYLSKGGGLEIIYSTAPDPGERGTDPGDVPSEPRAQSGLAGRLCQRVHWDRTRDASSVAGDGWAQIMIDMHVADATHPATRGLKDRRIAKWETDSPIDFDLAPGAAMHVLAWGRSIDTQRDSPMVFTSAFGRARVIQIVAGEIRAIDVGGRGTAPLMMSNLSPLTTDLIRRGGLWGAGNSAASAQHHRK